MPGRDPDRNEYDALRTDELRPESEVTEYEPPDYPTPRTRDRETVQDQRRSDTIDERLAQEQKEGERTMATEPELAGRKVAFLVAPEGAEQVELTVPWEAVREAGGVPELLSTSEGEVQAFNHLDKADRFPVDRVVSSTSADEYDALVLPGGVASPDQLRTDKHAVRFVRQFFEQAKPVAVICHGPWTLIEADVVRGKQLTSWPSLYTDLRNAGAIWVDERVVVDRGLVSSRNPDDLPAFCTAMVEQIAAGEHIEQTLSL
jgi:protease I